MKDDEKAKEFILADDGCMSLSNVRKSETPKLVSLFCKI